MGNEEKTPFLAWGRPLAAGRQQLQRLGGVCLCCEDALGRDQARHLRKLPPGTHRSGASSPRWPSGATCRQQGRGCEWWALVDPTSYPQVTQGSLVPASYFQHHSQLRARTVCQALYQVRSWVTRRGRHQAGSGRQGLSEQRTLGK